MTDADDTARIIADLQRRLSDLERAAQLPRSSVVDSNGVTHNARAALLAGLGASADAATALASVTDVQARADSKVTVFYNPPNQPPTEAVENPEYGDQWLRETTPTQSDLLRYDGDTWVLVQDQAQVAVALAAAQSAEATADAKIVTWWQPDAPAAAGAGIGDLWYRTNAAKTSVLNVYRWSGVDWAPLPLSTGALAAGSIDPDRLTVGVVANALQDPAFRLGVRSAPARWSIVGPDPTYPESNFARSTMTGAVAAHLPFGGTTDNTWIISDRVPVDPGRNVRVACQVRRNAAAITSTTGTVLARLRVGFYKPDNVTALSGPAQITALELADETVPDVLTTLEGTFTVPEGYTSVVLMYQVSHQQQGTVEFVKPEMQVLWNRVQSVNYVEGEVGWSLDEETTQFTNMQVLGGLGVTDLAADNLSIGGQDVATEYLDPLPRGYLTFARMNGTSSTAAVSAETLMFEFNGGALATGRLYRIHVHGHFQGSVAGDSFDMRLRYTTDGSPVVMGAAPSAILDASLLRIPVSTHVSTAFHLICYYIPLADYPTVRYGLTLNRTSGTGTGFIHITDVNRALEFSLEDLGAFDGTYEPGGNGVLTQKSFATAPVTQPPDPVQTYTKAWKSIWHRSYDGDNTSRSPDTFDLYQGYYSGTHGNTRSLFGFDHAAIRAALVGATVKSCKITYKVKHAWAAAGMTTYVSSHNYSTEPTTWAEANVNHDRIHKSGQKAGSTYTHELGVTVGNEFKSGATRGLGFGPAPSNSASAYYGYMYSGPTLTITYTK